MKFSQRMGIVPASKTLQLDSIDFDLLNGLWNAYHIFTYGDLRRNSDFSNFCTILWLDFFKLPIDLKPQSNEDKEEYIREWFFNTRWHRIYDFLEFIGGLDISMTDFNISEFKKYCNTIFERENSGYRFIGDKIVPITNSTEIKEIEEAIDKSGQFSAIKGANIHLNNSLGKLSDKKNPDYRNSIKESISAVEVVAKIISEDRNDTLGGALAKIKDKIKIHPALEKGFKNIYNYTSDRNGIRHGLMESDSCDFEDAKFLIVACSAFINYLIEKAVKAGIDL